MGKEVNITLDGKPVSVEEGITILNAAKVFGINIPSICYHEYCTANGLCRICVVEIEGSRLLVPSCITPVSEGMNIQTRSQRVFLVRKAILEMLASSVDLSGAPDILDLMTEYGADVERYPEAEKRHPDFLDDNPMYIRDYAKCILCWRCVQVCGRDVQYTYAINFNGRGYDTRISTFFDRPLPETTCVFCGQCVAVCPTGALKPKRQWLLEQGYHPEKIFEMTRPGKGSVNRNSGSQEL